MERLTLIIPDKPDPERDAVASAWERTGGTVLRLGRFWEPPALDPRLVRVYGNDAFCLVLQQKLGFELLSPPDDLLLRAPAEFLRRNVDLVALDDAATLAFPRFVKSLVPKQIRSRVYSSGEELDDECKGLEPSTALIVSEVVEFQAEARSFVLDGELLDGAAYEGALAREEIASFVRRLAGAMTLPAAVVVDVGRLSDGLALLEFNAAWGAGLNGCDAERVLPAIVRAST
jgi:hypothetical protein